jgi:hypothetical protein
MLVDPWGIPQVILAELYLKEIADIKTLLLVVLV